MIILYFSPRGDHGDPGLKGERGIGSSKTGPKGKNSKFLKRCLSC